MGSLPFGHDPRPLAHRGPSPLSAARVVCSACSSIRRSPLCRCHALLSDQTHICFYHDQGGQSATGALLDHIIATHPASPRVRERATAKGQTIYEALNELVQALTRERCALAPPSAAAPTADVSHFRLTQGRSIPRAVDARSARVSGLPRQQVSAETRPFRTMSPSRMGGLTKPLCCAALRPHYVGHLVPMRRCAG
jgi:hypothetical protein